MALPFPGGYARPPLRPAAPRQTVDFNALRGQDDLYRQALDAHRGNVTAAARSLGMSRAKLEYRLRKHGLYQGT